MGLSERRLAVTLVTLTLVTIVAAWWLTSALATVSEEIVSPRAVMSEPEGAQSAQSGASRSGAPIAQHPSGEGEQPPSSPTNGNVVPVETPAPPPPPTASAPVPTPIVPTPPIDLNDNDYDDDIDDVGNDRDDD